MLRVRAVWNGATTGPPYLSTFYFGPDGDQTAATGAVARVAAFLGDLDGVVSDEYGWETEQEVQQLSDAGVLEAVYNVAPTSGSGAATSALTPRASQGLIKWSTGIFLGGRRLQGHTYVPGVTINSVSGTGGPTPTYVAALTTAAGVLTGVPNASVVWSRTYATTSGITLGAGVGNFAVLRSRRD